MSGSLTELTDTEGPPRGVGKPSFQTNGAHGLQYPEETSGPQIQINSVNNLTTTIQNTLQMTVSTLLNQILENSNILISLRNKYYPIELDNNLTENEKTPYMLEWWELAHEVIIECGIQKHTLEKTVKECHLVLRDKVSEFFQLLSDYHIPVLVFSAGLGDVIDLCLHHANVFHDNMRVVSNFMQFNDDVSIILLLLSLLF
ncbi:unnamed protein product [Schistosoma margrebowiei]|uniref:5'-nucleotidase n=1 Tax=Schistosoma margrebowiei TaxID=48269 RepID=A0A183MNS5_9TREM|nr:unnamed protein product [Schistosoma margrebowiei]